MKEIEVKAYLKNKDTVIQKLSELSCTFESPVLQESIDFCPVKNADLREYLKSDFFLRIRTTAGKHVLSIKKPLAGEHHLSKTEHQTEVIDRKETESLLEIMGYYPSLELRKTRTIGHYKDYEICLDEVENLGSFIEIEKISDQNPSLVRQELQTLLFSLGISQEDEVDEGYDILMFKKLGRV